jgi:hypothetical protein
MAKFVSNETARWLEQQKRAGQPIPQGSGRIAQQSGIKLAKVVAIVSEALAPYQYTAQVYNARYNPDGTAATPIATGVPLFSAAKLSVDDYYHCAYAGSHWEVVAGSGVQSITYGGDTTGALPFNVVTGGNSSNGYSLSVYNNLFIGLQNMLVISSTTGYSCHVPSFGVLLNASGMDCPGPFGYLDQHTVIVYACFNRPAKTEYLTGLAEPIANSAFVGMYASWQDGTNAPRFVRAYYAYAYPTGTNYYRCQFSQSSWDAEAVPLACDIAVPVALVNAVTIGSFTTSTKAMRLQTSSIVI